MSNPVEQAQEAKTRGNAHFATGTLHGYREAAKEFEAATELDPTDHILFANLGAALLEQTKKEYNKSQKVEMLARALVATRRCTEIEAAWPKGWMRAAASEFDLVVGAPRTKILEPGTVVVTGRMHRSEYSAKAYSKPSRIYTTARAPPDRLWRQTLSENP